MQKKIAIIGATGMLGKPVVEAFIRQGYVVTALVRNLSHAKSTLPEGVRLIQGDIRQTEDIKTLLADNDTLYLNLNIKQNEKPGDFHTEAQGLANVLQVAKESNLKRIGFISSVVMNYQGMNGFHWWVFTLKQKAVQSIKDSGIPYTIFYPSTFMENFHHTYKRGNRILLAGKSKHKMFFIAADDYAKQVVRSFDLLTTENREYVVQGPEGFTAEEAAREFVQHHTKAKLSIAKAPLGMLKFIGSFSQQINYGAHIIEALNNYPEKLEAQRTWQELGEPAITLKDFAQR